MQKGNVRGNILPYAAQIASERAQPGLANASRASQAEQARFQNAYNDLAITASNSGLEEGFARIFRTLNAGAQSGTNAVQSLARAFNEATKWADDLLLFPAEFAATLNGKDGLLAEWLGKEETEQMRKDWQDIKNSLKSLEGLNFDGWLPNLKSTSKEIAAIMNWFTTLKNSPNQGSAEVDIKTNPITGTYQRIVRIGSQLLDSYEAGQKRNKAVYTDPSSIYYNDPEGYEAAQRDKAMAAAYDMSIGRIAPENNFSFGNISITVPYNPDTMSTPEDQGQFLADWFVARVQDTLPQYSEK